MVLVSVMVLSWVFGWLVDWFALVCLFFLRDIEFVLFARTVIKPFSLLKKLGNKFPSHPVS